MEMIALLLGLGSRWPGVQGNRLRELLQSMQSNDDETPDEYVPNNQGPKGANTIANRSVLDVFTHVDVNVIIGLETSVCMDTNIDSKDHNNHSSNIYSAKYRLQINNLYSLYDTAFTSIKSDISLLTRQSCGLNYNDDLSPPSIPSLIERREQGAHFTCGQKCNIAGNFLPNHMQRVAKYNNKPFCGTFSQDGNFLLTTTHDRVVRLYKYLNGWYNEFKKFSVSAVGWSILDTAFSPDANYFVYSSWSDYLYMHSIYGDPQHREPLLLSAEHPMFCVFSVVFSSDGRELFCGGNDGCLYIYDRGSQQCSKVRGHNHDINSVAFADESSQILYSAGDDGFCKVWDRRSLREDNPQPVGVLAGHMGGITYIDPRGDGRHLITNSKDQTIKLWDARVFSSKEAQESASTLVTVANNSWDYRWQNVPKKFLYPKKPLEGDTSVMTYRGHIVVQTLIRCHFSPAATTGQRYIYTGCGTGRVIIYDLLTGRIAKSLKGHKTVVRDISWHPYNPEIVSTSWDGEIARWRYLNANDLDDLSGASTDITSDSDDESPKPARRTRSQTAKRSKRFMFRNFR